MKKIQSLFLRLCLFLCLFLCLSSLSSAQLLIGSRAAGMGGAGTAVVYDLASAYYNPAALMKSSIMAAETKISLGGSYQNIDKLLATLGSLSNPSKFLADNYASAVDVNGSVSGVIGFNVRKIGISVIPMMSAAVTKTASSLAGSITGTGNAAGVLTLGGSYNFPGLPVGTLHLGTNIKYIYAANGSLTASALTGGTQLSSIGSGFGVDVGALTTVSVPMVSDLSISLVARNLGQSTKYKNKSQSLTPSGTTFVASPEVDLADTTATDTSTYVLGASATIPVVNMLIAVDLENIPVAGGGTNTHIGIEYPLLFNFLILRAGAASGAGLSLSTLGAKIGLPILTLDTASVTDNNNSKNNYVVVDIQIGL
ncbi:hypothetical protein HZC34_00470 [Candidatus Saganbacteria bacterium]|nr:hypothetical protein [Candidatus Saganbacteria bacterium]